MSASVTFTAVLIAGATVVASGCASVMSGRHAELEVYSNVTGAHVSIRDRKGEEVANTIIPGKVALKRKNGYIFPAKYTAVFSAPGYESAEVEIKQKVNPWVAGNVLFFQAGLIGLVIDNVTGATWQPEEKTIYQELIAIDNFSPQFPTAEKKVDTNIQPAAGEFLR